VVGNFDLSLKAISITHSYYDSSELKDEKSYWNRKDELLNDSSVSIPLFLTNGYYTRLAIYPIFSPSNFTLSYFFYDQSGQLLKQANTTTEITSASNSYSQIDFGELAANEQLPLDRIASVNLVCNWKDKAHIPTRVKFGLNVGKGPAGKTLPSNICFAPLLGNPNTLKKKGTFKWAPFINIGQSVISFTNSGSLKDYHKQANIQVSFHREADDNTLSRKFSIPANGSLTIHLDKDEELLAFFNGKSGWIAAQSDNPFLSGYYFDFFENGSVCADHVF
jgi:hypothetical protein